MPGIATARQIKIWRRAAAVSFARPLAIIATYDHRPVSLPLDKLIFEDQRSPQKAPSDEGAVSEADWGRENPKSSALFGKRRKTQRFLSLSRLRRQLPHQREPWVVAQTFGAPNSSLASRYDTGRISCVSITDK